MTPSDRLPVTTVRRWGALVTFVVRMLGMRATRTAPKRTWSTVGIVALTFTLMLTIGGISVGLATQSTVQSDDVEFWVVPESGTTLTTVVSVDAPQLGSVHARSREIDDFDGVVQSTPVLVQPVRVRADSAGQPDYVLAVGVVPSQRPVSVLGVSTASLSPGDPYYDGGSYDGEFTGDVVLSTAAAEVLGASEGEGLTVASTSTVDVEQGFSVTAVDGAGRVTAGGTLPVALFRLGELQALTGAETNDLADQILVQTNAPGVRSDLEAVYPTAQVVARGGVSPRSVVDDGLPLAVALTAVLVGVVVGTLFVLTMVGLEVDATRRELAVLTALGFSARDRLVVVFAMTLWFTLAGAVLGTLLAIPSIELVNAVATATLATGDVAHFRPSFLLYALGIAVLTTVLALPYPLYIARQTDVRRELTQ